VPEPTEADLEVVFEPLVESWSHYRRGIIEVTGRPKRPITAEVEARIQEEIMRHRAGQRRRVRLRRVWG
jgi:hypothetical protein